MVGKRGVPLLTKPATCCGGAAQESLLHSGAAPKNRVSHLGEYYPRPTVFTGDVARQIRALAGKITIAEIAERLGVNRDSMRNWGRRHKIDFRKPDFNQPTVFTLERTARIRALAGHAPAREIAAEVGVTLASLRSWADHHDLSLARPRKQTWRARYNALRQLAFRVGLRIYCQAGRISLWVCVAENQTFEQAEKFLKQPNRRERLTAISLAW